MVPVIVMVGICVCQGCAWGSTCTIITHFTGAAAEVREATQLGSGGSDCTQCSLTPVVAYRELTHHPVTGLAAVAQRCSTLLQGADLF